MKSRNVGFITFETIDNNKSRNLYTFGAVCKLEDFLQGYPLRWRYNIILTVSEGYSCVFL